ncbi:winged helix-turn-helix transcriptional regulator [Haliea sp. E17]|uniref:winged helix-turn-helix transcriptional regulator n=1 Tax=Haliea sp. E17 TaxID=3401576 RepID=UPI003AAE2104
MFDYGEACPISMATSVLCERWTLQIVRELFFGSTRYSEIQKYIPNLSPSLLRDRLRFLEEQGIVLRKRCGSGNRFEYHLTPSGKALAPVLTELGRWGMRYAREGMTDKQNTISGLMRDFAGGINVEELPSGDTVVQFHLTDLKDDPKRYIYIRDGVVQECAQDMGFEVDVYITSTLPTLTRVWYGEIDIHRAIDAGLVKLVAPPVYQNNLRRWLGISSFATDNPRIFAS